uniref:Transcription initiation factor TFIID subunit 12 n=1 Tax=Daphnia sinensis TaxID=1820382 RepID=A0A4Y7N7C6_9CRUS|nr:EOG090X0HZC [Daphnia sinensis]SVE92126.1 EOG090X0HZC [Daphnia sinensis]
MDFSHLIRGTREFFQGHPGKPKDNGIVPPFINFPEAKNGVKRNHETSYNLQSHSQVIKSNCPTQPNIHGTVSQYYHEPYSKNFTSNQQSQSSEQVDEFHAPNKEVKNQTWIQSAAVYSTHTPKIHYGEQKVWQQNIYSDGGDVSANTRLHHNPPIPATNSSMVTPTACQGHQQPVTVKNNECMVPAVNNLHQRLPEASDCSSYSTNFVRPAFVQDFKSKNVHQYQRTVPSRDDLNLMNFRESGRQPTFGKMYNQPLHLASDWRNQTEHTSAPVSCDCLFNRPCPLHRHSKQQDVPTPERQSSEWGSNIQNISIGNKFTRQKYEHTSLELPNERPNALQNPEMMKHHQTSFQQNYQIQELPNTTSSSSSTNYSNAQNSSSTSGGNNENQVLTRSRLQDLVREVDPNEQLDEEVEELLLQIADDFIESTVNASCQLAKHRQATALDVTDVQMHLERQWNMWIPGFGTDELRPYKRAPVTEAHKQRMALIRKQMKKF